MNVINYIFNKKEKGKRQSWRQALALDSLSLMSLQKGKVLGLKE